MNLLIPEFQFLASIIEDETLERTIKLALTPKLLYRRECSPVEPWAVDIGTTQLFVRKGLMPVSTKPRRAGQDPVIKDVPYEQYAAHAFPLNDKRNIHMPTSRAVIGDQFMSGIQDVVSNAGITMNRAVRDRLYAAYGSGHTVADSAGSTQTTIEVASIAGFTHQLTSEGKLQPVSTINPKQFYIQDVLQAVSVIAAQPASASRPEGPGTLTIQAPGVTVAAGNAIRAYDAPTIIRSGSGNTVDALSGSDWLTLADIRLGVAIMQRNSVPPHPETGLYHVHLDSIAQAHLFADPEFRQASQGEIGNDMYGRFWLKDLMGCRFYMNNDTPLTTNVGGLVQSRPSNAALAMAGEELPLEVINNAGVRVIRTLITGGENIEERYIPENEYVTEAGITGVQKFGQHVTVTSGGITISVDHIRLILKAPTNDLMDQVGIIWSWSGDFPVPSDRYGGSDPSRFKRGIMIESGSNI